jgi:hypothetical protein
VIYDFPTLEEPIRQGDIFVGLPRIDLSLREIPVVRNDNSFEKVPWDDLASGGDPVKVIAALRPVAAIVATQDCDAIRATDITLCEIHPFVDVYGQARTANSPKAWASIITQHARQNLKWFYLPPDQRIGFGQKMAVDFMTTLRVAREELEGLRPRRKGRLNSEADEHFRERISDFFRRYPYDEWYPLSSDEYQEYRKNYPDARPREWQQTPP